MTTPAIRRFGTLRAEPWRNGAGSTTVLATGVLAADGTVLEHSAGAAPVDRDWDWRISIARIDRAAPFSSFPGVARLLMPVGDRSLELVIDGRRRRVARHEVVAFDGTATVSSTAVAAPALVLNVMVRQHLAAVIDAAPSSEHGGAGVVVGLGGSPADSPRALRFGDSVVVQPGDPAPTGALVRIARRPL